MICFIDQHRDDYGVEPICNYLPIAPSTYYEHKSIERDPSGRSPRAQQDAMLKAEIKRIWHEHHEVYGVRKVWRQLRREGFEAARCTVGRLMRELGLQGVRRGARCKTTIPSLHEEKLP